MVLFKFIPLLLLILLLLACKNKPTNPHENFKTEIFDTRAFNYFEPFIEKKKLNKINTGYDSLQLRIWYSFSFSDSIDLFTIRKENTGDWAGSWERFYSNFESENIPRTMQIDSGQKIWEKLYHIGIMEYYGMTREELGRYGDGELIIIEFATPNYYKRVSSQASIAYHSKNDADAVKKANEILEVFWAQIESEHKMKR